MVAGDWLDNGNRGGIGRVVHHSVILDFDVPSYRTGVAQQRGQDQKLIRQE